MRGGAALPGLEHACAYLRVVRGFGGEPHVLLHDPALLRRPKRPFETADVGVLVVEVERVHVDVSYQL